MQSSKPHQGLAILAVLIVLVTSTITALLAFHSLKLQKQREREVELLEIGQEFLRAMSSYVQSTPGGGADYPRSMQDLLDDKRHPAVKRHLRRIAIDPMTHQARWGIVRGPDERIVGIYSLSQAKPFKRANFPQKFSGFSTAQSYQQWRFVLSQSADTAQPPRQPPINRPAANVTSPLVQSITPSPSSVD